MIKLKNLWKIALATMAMSTMLVACDTAKEDDDKGSKDDVVDTTVYVEFPTEAKVSANGVYTAKLVKEGADLSGGFGSVAGKKESIKVVLAHKDVVAKIIDGTITSDADLFTDDNKCYVYANNDVGNALFTSATVTEGTYVQPAGFGKYTGLAITKDADGNYIVKFDVSKIDNAILLAKGTPKGTLGEYGEAKVDADTDAWNAVDTLKTNYIPMVLGSVTGNSGAAYPFNFWNAGIAIMEPSTENYPTNIKEEAELVVTVADMKYVCSNAGNFELTWDGNTATAEIEIAEDADLASWNVDADVLAFGICKDTDWSVKYTGATCTLGGDAQKLTRGADNNNTVKGVELGKTYIITVDKTAETVKVTAK